MPKIILTENQKEILSNHAEQENPNESCAILFGKEVQDSYKVERIFLAHNIEKSPVNVIGKIISPDKSILDIADGKRGTFRLQS